MTTFITDVLNDLLNKNKTISDLVFILPSKRAGIHLKHQLAKLIDRNILSPEILSVEEFVEELSQLKKVSNTELLFMFYRVYQELTIKEEQDSFDSFLKWAQVLIQDFNEIDRYRIPPEHIFNYLSAIKKIEHAQHWSMENEQTDFIKNYLAFWNELYKYYDNFVAVLLEHKLGYQGLIYREAVENLETYVQNNSSREHIFLGFNALNTSEEIIIQELLQNDMAEIYWDIDQVILEHPYHDAGLFIRRYLKNWRYFQNNEFRWKTNHYSSSKHIEVIGIPKNIGQAKYIGNLLDSMKSDSSDLGNTAIVLADENLLTPTLNSLPPSIKTLNITMGLPLESIPLASLFDQIFKMHMNYKGAFYYKEVIGIISHQYIRPLINRNEDVVSEIIENILKNNIVYLSYDRLSSLMGPDKSVFEILFMIGDNSVDNMLQMCQKLILKIKTSLDKEKSVNKLALEYLFRFNELFNELDRLNKMYTHIVDLNTLHSIFKELLSTATLDFKGEPLEGLQIMGMLESRVLDFETVIISSVNEGVLPSGKTNNSFIPYDVKLENELPTYKEKDAIYSYHFYRLLHRAKNVYILYNTEMDTITGGERSRFITQMEIEGPHELKHKVVSPKVKPQYQSLIEIRKTGDIIDKLKEIAKKGFSPSTLTNYIRNPLDFYHEKILGIKAPEEVEESVAFNTLGSVVHNTLEDLYKEFTGEYLTVESLKALRPKIRQTIEQHFKNEYLEGDLTTGKNLIIFEIAKRYVDNFISNEIDDLKRGNQIKILGLEQEANSRLYIPEIDLDIKFTGKVDRIDQYNGVTRIIDYKTGKVSQGQVEVSDWELLTSDYKKYSKSFQLLMYAYMLANSKTLDLPLEAGIISFKNLNSGVLKFTYKEQKVKDQNISVDTMKNFEIELKRLLCEIFDPSNTFIEKPV